MELPPGLQIVSDLHLETPYLHARYLCLLGDIGRIKDDGLSGFLESLLQQTPNLNIFYVFGNHEAYQLSIANATARMRDRIFLLDRTRLDITPKVTVLGCTLWSNILPQEVQTVNLFLTDFHEERGIQGWTSNDHVDAHRRDLEWLNTEVEKIQRDEPYRQIAILTHHSPTKDPRANREQHLKGNVNSAFVTDLSSEPCWKSPQVKLWAFGHTHYNFPPFIDEVTGKLLFVNHKGYSKAEGIGWNPDRFRKHQ
ncbi:Ser/Thr protein phosphatase superfamily protein [Viridothelium virens]|uniref:Ser/Thr protein phosphatase superfamily protein n=1 Tax=Viridothelium virens TaxID=1048519 RepID=A0A6A6H8F1_VIRVR|nr:Ser/Thr protein phosphatase superfamily protein [Viridothelium virens]